MLINGHPSQAAEDLVERHYAAVFNLAYRTLGRREDAEDVAQQTFTRALARLDDLREPSAAGAWLLRIAANCCLDLLRTRRGEAPEAEWPVLADSDRLAIPSQAAELHELRLNVWQATLQLPPQQRLALALRELHGMSYAEIATALSTTVGAVETLLFRARQGFRRAYAPDRSGAFNGACGDVLERLSASVDGELRPHDQARIDAHLPSCANCRFAARELRALSRLYGLVPLALPSAGAKVAALLGTSTAASAGSGALSAGAVVSGSGAMSATAAVSGVAVGAAEMGGAVGAGLAVLGGAAGGGIGAFGGSAGVGFGFASLIGSVKLGAATAAAVVLFGAAVVVEPGSGVVGAAADSAESAWVAALAPHHGIADDRAAGIEGDVVPGVGLAAVETPASVEAAPPPVPSRLELPQPAPSTPEIIEVLAPASAAVTPEPAELTAVRPVPAELETATAAEWLEPPNAEQPGHPAAPQREALDKAPKPQRAKQDTRKPAPAKPNAPTVDEPNANPEQADLKERAGEPDSAKSEPPRQADAPKPERPEPPGQDDAPKPEKPEPPGQADAPKPEKPELPGQADLLKAEPEKPEPPRANPPQADPARAEPVGRDPQKAQPVKSAAHTPDVPKPDSLQAAPSKSDSPKPDAAKPESPKPESATPGSPKPESPKPEPPKPEPATQDLKPDAANQGQPQSDAAKPTAPKAEPAKPDSPKPEVPKVEPSRPEPPKVDLSRPTPEVPKVELSLPEPPKVEPSRPEPPKVEPSRPEPPRA